MNSRLLKRFVALFMLMIIPLSLTSCVSKKDDKIKIKLLFIPKFEPGEMSGDEIGEAQLFYERYCMNSEKYTLANGYPLYVNKENGVAMGLTHAGKANTIMFTTGVLSDERFDFSDAYIMCIGCAGSSYGNVTMGDVVVIREAVDFDLGYQTIEADENGDVCIKWFENPDTADNAHKKLNEDLVNWAYEKTKDVKLKTTEITLRTLERNFPGEEWAKRNPKVLTGTSVSSDTYWKGEKEHEKANKIVEYYGCADPYAITEMEDSSCAVAVDAMGMLDRLIILRASVNVDILLDGATPESTWGKASKYEDAVQEENAENLDIFVPAMENLFAVGSVIADSILDGTVGQ